MEIIGHKDFQFEQAPTEDQKRIAGLVDSVISAQHVRAGANGVRITFDLIQRLNLMPLLAAGSAKIIQSMKVDEVEDSLLPSTVKTLKTFGASPGVSK